MTLTQIEAGKRGPALMNRLVGDASIYKKLLDRKPLTSEDGVKYFMETVRLHFTRGFLSVFRRRCFSLFRARRENMEMVKWIEQMSLLLKRLKDSWMNMLPTTDRYLLHRSEPQRQNLSHADMARGGEERRSRSQELLSPDFPETTERWNATEVGAHERLFPFSDNLTT